MEQGAGQTDVMALMAENEEAIGGLYEAHADRFPVLRDFWLGLASEEANHARWIRALQAQIEAGVLYYEGRFKAAAIATFGEGLIEETTKARQGEMSLINALYVEEALLERRYFEVAEGDSVRVKHLLLRLEEATETHLQRVREAHAKHR